MPSNPSAWPWSGHRRAARLSRTFIAAAPLALSALLGSCGGGSDGGTEPPPPPQPTLASIAATPATVSALQIGSTVTLVMQAFDTQGAVMSSATGYVFSSSSPTIASVSSSGVVQGVAAGSATVTVSLTIGSVTRTTTVPVTVAAPPLGSIAVTPATIAALAVGASQQLSMQALDTQGAPIAGATGYVFLSANETIASVNATGRVTGVAPGSTIIVVSLTVGAVTQTALVDVTVVSGQQVLGSIIAAPVTIPSLPIGGTQGISVQALTPQGAVIAGATGYTFSSSNQLVASVSAQGVVTGVAAGTATITVSLTLSGVTKTATVSVTVVASLPTLVQVQATTANTFDPASVDVARGGTVIWNFSTVTHNVQFAAGTAGAPANIPDTANGRAIRTFDTLGTFNYICTIHAGMNGTVIVR